MQRLGGRLDTAVDAALGIPADAVDLLRVDLLRVDLLRVALASEQAVTGRTFTGRAEVYGDSAYSLQWRAASCNTLVGVSALSRLSAVFISHTAIDGYDCLIWYD